VAPDKIIYITDEPGTNYIFLVERFGTSALKLNVETSEEGAFIEEQWQFYALTVDGTY